jgi:iron complex outermembrane receptor protein
MRQADTVNKALRYVPGVTPESRVTATLFDQYTIRGFQSYRNYYDGLPLQANGLWNLYPQVDAFATESIEVLKGPTSVLYGAAPPGGMVNQIAKTANGDETTQVRLRVGDHQFSEIGIDTAGSMGDVDYRLVGLGRQKDGQQQTTKEQRLTLAPSMVWQAGVDTSITLSGYYQDDPKMNPSTSLHSVGTLYDAPYGKLDSDGYSGDQNWNQFDRTVVMLGYKINHQLTQQWSLLQNLRYTDGEALQRNTYTMGLAPDQQTLIRSAYITDESQHGFVVDNQLAGKFNTGGVEHSLLVDIH